SVRGGRAKAAMDSWLKYRGIGWAVPGSGMVRGVRWFTRPSAECTLHLVDEDPECDTRGDSVVAPVSGPSEAKFPLQAAHGRFAPRPPALRPAEGQAPFLVGTGRGLFPAFRDRHRPDRPFPHTALESGLLYPWFLAARGGSSPNWAQW
ncbi:MAG: hypothetical protein ACP5QO_12480, partial [Clostridia bacterium]